MAAHNAFDALPLCKFMAFCDITTGKEIANLVSAIMGIELTCDDLTEIGERLVALKRAFNIRSSLTKLDDRLQKRMLTPAPDTPDKHDAPILELRMKEFYEAAG